MGWLHLQIKKSIPISPSQQPIFDLPPPPPLNLKTSGFSLNDKVSPSVLLIIIILAIIFFISGLLHLLIRFLLRPARGWDPDEMNDVTVLQGQLQQLFHLHDAGVDQSFIDTLPVFNYKSIIGVKSPFDCAVCLSEFEPEDKLRLLPKCSHAFHIQCIDTWLLSHSTCPICRASLFPDLSSNHPNRSPVVLVLESGSESSREIVGAERVNSQSHLSACSENENRASLYDLFNKSSEIQLKEDQRQEIIKGSAEKIVSVKLGKFKNVDQGVGEGCSENNVDKRRCFSMGSFGYVMDESSSLKVPIRTPMKKQSSKKPGLNLNLGQRAAMSECGWDSRREFNGFEAFRSLEKEEMVKVSRNKDNVINDKAIGGGRESFSISKIWLRGKKDKQSLGIGQSSRRAVSFRFPLQNNGVEGVEESKAKNGGHGGGGEGGRRGGGGNGKEISEVETDRWENGGSEYSYYDVEMQSCYSMDSQANAPSFARKTLLWLMGNVNQNKVVHSSFSSNL